ncbi:hypothetical protein Pla108_11190 [Botrimarina colliarenosi]|uniref:Uncharacterized protein n=1 Tax=Botrimarina colliarenosi TaxID=2528001 RepID=A0A5C6APQ7_9BACT|nr:DUF2007 domain-containing protein [Botrimarina colliarenosi]TWU00174.1 hypothetical protein Pla108_11190 [Botrimarina colliarenosi]
MSDPHKTVKLTETPTEADAIMICDALAEHGVRAVYNGDMVAGFRAEAPGMVRVLVRADELDLAKRLLAEEGIESASVDWSQVDVGDADEGEDDSITRGATPFSWMRHAAVVVVLWLLVLLIL